MRELSRIGRRSPMGAERYHELERRRTIRLSDFVNNGCLAGGVGGLSVDRRDMRVDELRDEVLSGLLDLLEESGS